MAPRTALTPIVGFTYMPAGIAALAIAVGALALSGWLLDIPLLTKIFPAWGPMRWNTAIAFILIGATLGIAWLPRSKQFLRAVAIVLPLLVCAWAMMAAGEWMFRWDLNLDLWPTLAGREPSPTERMPFATALSFLLLGCSLILAVLDRAHVLMQFLAVGAMMLGVLAVTAFFYHAGALDSARAGRSLAFHTIFLFVLIAASILTLCPDRGLVALLRSDDLGGMVARRLLPVAVVFPIVVGWICVEGHRAGLYGFEKGAAFFALANVICFTALILWSAASLHLTDAERRQAEESVRQSQARLDAVIENMTEGVVVANLDGRLVHWNKAALQIHDFSDTEDWCRLLPDFARILSLSTPEGEELPFEDWPMSRLLRGERLRGYQVRMKKIGTNWERILSYGGAQVQDATGTRVVFLTMVDITEVKQAEADLRDSRAMLQNVLDLIPLGVFWKDRSSRYLGCNAVVSRALGFAEPAQLVGRTDADMPSVAPEEASFFLRKDDEVMASQAPQYHVIESLTRADGKSIVLDTNKIPICNDQGTVIGLLGTWEDITQRRRSEESLATYTERIRLLHLIDQALIAGDEPSAIASAALPLLRDVLGVRRVVLNLFDLVKNEVEWLAAAGSRRVYAGPPIRYPMDFMGDVEGLRRGEAQFIDVADLPRSPEVAALLASKVNSYVVVPMIASGELIGAVSFGGTDAPLTAEKISIAQEVAAQFAIVIVQARLHSQIKRQAQDLELRVLERTHELEEAHARLQQSNNELQTANHELEAFSYSVSHDLRAPLRAIDGFSRIVLEDYATTLPDPARKLLQGVRANTLQMGRLVDDLLAFSRLSRQPVKRETVESTRLVRECLDALRGAANGRSIDFRIQDMPTCLADPALLKQVWINLLANAIKYTGKREAAVIDVGCDSSNGKEVFFVKDNGVGFDMRYAHKLFGVFQRLHRAEDYEGTGVGLAIVQRVVHRHGGNVWADAKVNVGAT
ncbi:MAG TPA: ATP-binding protein, partial [Gemmataceae bacterium]|nr:ATP-binding protein [Gemmataceae bacterium]